MPLPANAMAPFSNRINNRYLHIFLQQLCQSNLALTFQIFCCTLNYTTPALRRCKTFLSSIYAKEKVYSRVFLLPTICGFHSLWKTSFGRSSMSQRSSSLFLTSIYSLASCYSTIRCCFALEHTTTVVIPPLINKRRLLLCI